ncbi:MAG: hypothetical protein JXR48_14780 [Candidatus Delongbacteria bacterium]|nr:hypothetical protein [Candidatus Delongbacteria bacterium]MBN2836222.1 hypothetical protein [Candidatus Delongbacteria bacterium]
MKLLFLFLVCATMGLFATSYNFKIDEEKDQLEPKERRSALIMFESSLKEKGFDIDKESNSYFVLYHIILGDLITVIIESPEGSVKKKEINKLSDLPRAYDQLIGAIDTNKKADEISTLNRSNVTANDIRKSEMRLKSENFKYAKLGVSTISHDKSATDIHFGFGYRAELDEFAVDVSIFNMLFSQAKDDYEWDGEWIRLALIYYFDSLNSNSLYIGGGLSYGASKILEEHYFDDVDEIKTGMRGNVLFGYEMLRVSTIRFLIEGEAILPFYETLNYDLEYKWAPVLKLGIGIGF